jgi:hypothetical protein
MEIEVSANKMLCNSEVIWFDENSSKLSSIDILVPITKIFKVPSPLISTEVCERNDDANSKHANVAKKESNVFFI